MNKLAAFILIVLMVGCGVQREAVKPENGPVGRPGSAANGRPDTTTTASASTATVPSIRDVDFFNRTYTVTCGLDVVEIPVVDGEWEDPRGPTFGFVDYLEIEFFDASGDGNDDAVLSFGCGVGAGTVTAQVLVMTSTPAGISQVGETIIGFNPRAAAGGLTVDNPHYEEDDPRCCPSSYVRTLYNFRHGDWTEEDSAPIAEDE